jgi:DNA-directed RNA polymerase sigma subunit (sigma70/sigma32)
VWSVFISIPKRIFNTFASQKYGREATPEELAVEMELPEYKIIKISSDFNLCYISMLWLRILKNKL